MGTRDVWVDQLRFLGIMAVILGHISTPLSSFIYSWHMPLFFIISGFFCSPRDSRSILKIIQSDFRKLMIPYFIFSFFGLGIEQIKRILLHRELLDLGRESIAILLSMKYEALKNQYGFVLWFLPTLFFFKILFQLLYRIPLLKLWNAALPVVLFFWISFRVSLPFGLDIAMNALVWLWIGSLLFELLKGDQVAEGWAVAAGILSAAIAFLNRIPSLDLANKQYSSVAMNLIWAIAFIGCITIAIRKLNRGTSPSWGRETRSLMIFHPYTNNAAHLAVESFIPGFWPLKFTLSLFLLYWVVKGKQSSRASWIAHYV